METVFWIYYSFGNESNPEKIVRVARRVIETLIDNSFKNIDTGNENSDFSRLLFQQKLGLMMDHLDLKARDIDEITAFAMSQAFMLLHESLEIHGRILHSNRVKEVLRLNTVAPAWEVARQIKYQMLDLCFYFEYFTRKIRSSDDRYHFGQKACNGRAKKLRTHTHRSVPGCVSS